MILIRHGQSDFNAGFSTDFNSNLTNFGIKQSEHAGEVLSSYLKNKYIPNIKIMVSPFKRCLQTASIISGICGLDIELDYDLIEHVCEKNGFTQENKPWKINRNFTIYLLDNDEAIIERMKNFYRRYNHSDVIVVSHGGPINILTILASGGSVNKYPEWDGSIKNCCITDTKNLTEVYKI